ncbi:MAG: RimK family alpha-L-glutamate ligase [Eubacterium sp.]|nr:RimK family alpha-L-glutamate ligase [Eubacterium sp.]
MTGFLVTNAYLKGEKFDTLHNHLVNCAESMGISLKLKNNEEMLFCDEACDFVLFWDKDVNLAKKLENKGVPVFNSARSIELCDDKAKTYLALENTVKQPATIVAPLSFYGADYRSFAQKAAVELGFPLVFKERFGSFGEQVFLCNTVDEILSHISGKPFLLQEFIKEASGEDVRVEIVDGRCVSAMKRSNKNDFRSNITNGGTAVPYTPTDDEVANAVKACKTLGLTFGGVDILGGGYVCEVNSNAHIINLMNVTGVDVAPQIFDTIKTKI